MPMILIPVCIPVWCWNIKFFMSTVYHFISPVAHFFFKLHISLWTYSLLPQPSLFHAFNILYILPLVTQVGCVCLPRFSLFCLFVYLLFDFLVLLFVCVFLWFGFLVAAGVLLFCRNSTSFPVFPRITSGEQRNWKATSLQIGSQEYQINHHPNAKNTANNL